MKKFLSFSFALFAVAAWVACGGDDGGTNNGGTDTTPDVIGEGTGGDVPLIETTPEVQPEVVVDTPKEEEICVPNCEGKVCGLDGCGGQCGSGCPEGQICTAKQDKCVVPCDPTTEVTSWAKTGGLSSLYTLPEATDTRKVEDTCPDFSGDGKGDNGLKSLASTINGELKKMVANGEFNIIMEFQGVTDFQNTASFKLVGLIGEPDPTDTTVPPEKWLVMPESYNPETCDPYIAFEGAKIEAGKMKAGPTTFSLTLSIAELGGSLTFTLEQGQVAMDIKDDKVTAENGVLAGVLTKQQIDATLDRAKQQCDVPEPPDFCSYLPMADSFLPMLFDLDLDKDGVEDAASLCLVFGLRGVTVTGFVPADTPAP